MKTTPLVLKCVAVLAGIGLLSAPGAKANTNATDKSKNMPTARVQQPLPQRVVLVQTTESRIPQRVVISGTQVNGASPMTVLQSRHLLASGGIDVATMLYKLDPSITVRRH